MGSFLRVLLFSEQGNISPLIRVPLLRCVVNTANPEAFQISDLDEELLARVLLKFAGLAATNKFKKTNNENLLAFHQQYREFVVAKLRARCERQSVTGPPG